MLDNYTGHVYQAPIFNCLTALYLPIDLARNFFWESEGVKRMGSGKSPASWISGQSPGAGVWTRPTTFLKNDCWDLCIHNITVYLNYWIICLPPPPHPSPKNKTRICPNCMHKWALRIWGRGAAAYNVPYIRHWSRTEIVNRNSWKLQKC